MKRFFNLSNAKKVDYWWREYVSLRATSTQSFQKNLMNYRKTEWRTSKYLFFYLLINISENNKHRQNSYKNTFISTFIIINMKKTKIEMLDQSDEISQSIIKEKKSNVQKIIDDLSSYSSKYSSIAFFIVNSNSATSFDRSSTFHFLFFSFLFFFK
jgi:hypothetical protein